MSVVCIDKYYNWKDTTLMEFLNEGNIPCHWKDFFNQELVQKELQKISDYLQKEGKTRKIYPWINNVFRAFSLSPKEIKVVIFGQDPYHNPSNNNPLIPGSATGLCFDVKPGNKLNPSLRNIYSELKREGYNVKEDGRLVRWSKEIFLLNTALTVEKGDADSHTAIWYEFSELVVKYISENTENVVWFLFGNRAQEYLPFILQEKHLTLCTSHPSPFSWKRATKKCCAFYGSDIFRKCNEYLKEHGKKEIDWEK